MGIRVEAIGFHGAAEAMNLLGRLTWIHDCEPNGRRLKWYKKRHDCFLKPSQLRHRRTLSIQRAKQKDRRYPALDGAGCVIEDDHHWC
jgi:hypothetical protein